MRNIYFRGNSGHARGYDSMHFWDFPKNSLFPKHISQLDRQLVRQWVNTLFASNNHVPFCLWWKESLVRYQKVLKYYHHDWVGILLKLRNSCQQLIAISLLIFKLAIKYERKNMVTPQCSCTLPFVTSAAYLHANTLSKLLKRQ